MSQTSRNLAIAAFKSRAENAYQSGSKLKDRVMVISGVTAETQRFPVVARTDATRRASQAPITPANVGNAKPTAILTPKESFDLLDRQDAALSNVDFMRAYGETHGKAVSREYDEDIIGALNTAFATGGTNAYARPGLTSNLAFETSASGRKIQGRDIAKARAMLMDEDFDVNMDEVTFVYPALQFGEMATDEVLSSMDYLQQGRGRDNVTSGGNFGQLYGAKPIAIGQAGRSAGHGRLPDNTCYMFCKSAVGLAVGTTERLGVVEFIELNRSWLIGAECNAGATRIQHAGIVSITIKA